MKLIDFAIIAEAGFSDKETVNHRCLHIAEAVRMELSIRPPLHAPFRKIVVELYNTTEASPTKNKLVHVGSVVEVRAGVAESAVFADDNNFRCHLLDAIERGIKEISEVLGLPFQGIKEILDSIRGREQVFHYQLQALSKKDRATCRRIEVFVDMTERDSVLKAIVYSADRQVIKEEIVAAYQQPMPLEYFFPVASTIIRDGFMIFRDANRETIGKIKVIDEPCSPQCASEELTRKESH